MYQMTEEERVERSRVKELHRAARNCLPVGDRYRNLAWGFVRGFKYRRIERSHRIQPTDVGYGRNPPYYVFRTDAGQFVEHNMPSPDFLFKVLNKFMPEISVKDVEVWLKDRTGGIAVRPRRPKSPQTSEIAPASLA